MNRLFFLKPSIKMVLALGLSLSLNSCKIYYKLFYADPTKCFAEAQLNKPYDAIIVPGFPHDSGRVNVVLKQRIKWATYLCKNGYTKNVIFSGSAVHSSYIEAKIMKLYAIQLGIDEKHIYTEEKAEHTTENLYYSYILAKKLGWAKIAFATDPAQSSFMKPFIRKFKLQVTVLPSVYDSIVNIYNDFGTIDESSAYVFNFVPLNKREGKIKILRGSRGHKVKIEIRKARRLKRKKK